jgi:hypothetical protein
MSRLEVFDPAMCCSTGVCGVEVDPVLPRFAADLAWLAEQGVEVHRHNLAHEPAAFVASEVVKKAIEENGVECLPLVLVDGRVLSMGAYPTRDQLAKRTVAKPRIRLTADGPVCVPNPDGSSCC